MRSAEDIERFKNLAAGWQSITVLVAVIVGGIWTVYTFSALGVKSKAEAELFQQAVLAINVDAKQETIGTDSGYYISAMATVENKGNRNTFLNFTTIQPFRVIPVVFDDEGRGLYQIDAAIELSTMTAATTVRRGAVLSYPMFARVPKAGIYLIEFSAPLSATELEVHQSSAGNYDSRSDIIVWKGVAYVIVQ